VGINREISEQIRCYCGELGLTLLRVIPFNDEMNKATMKGDAGREI